MIDQIEKPKIERVEIGDNNRYGKFVVNPLERGFGTDAGQLPAQGASQFPAGRGRHQRSHRGRAA